MKKFLIKKTNDGLKHLYLDDSSKEGFTKIKTADNAEVFGNLQNVVLSNKGAFAKSLFFVKDDEVVEVFLPRDAKIDVVDDNCIYELDGLWYVKNVDQTEVLLGKRYEVYFGVPEVFKVSKLVWTYFLDEHDSVVDLCYLTDKNVVKIGPYCKVEVHSGLGSFICKRYDGFYDIYRVRENGLIKQENHEIVWLVEGVYVWSDDLQAWYFYEGFRLWCDNVIYHCEGLEFATLYEVGKNSIRVVAKNGWKFCEGYIRINGMRYYLDNKTGLVDFNKPIPEPNFWQKLFGKR